MKVDAGLRIAALVLVALVLGGCLGRTPPPNVYLLTALRPDSNGPASGIDVAVGVGPVTVPEYLKRSEIVSRAGCGSDSEVTCGELRLAELDRWAEPVDEAVARVLSEDLSLLLATERVVRYPWRPSTPVDYQVTVDLIRFDADAAGKTVLTARWAVVGPEEHEVLHLARSSFEETVPAAGYGARVAALSRALAQLAREIADAIRTRQEG